MSRLDVDSNFGQIAETIENHYSGSRPLPPANHPNARTCPQCDEATWRLTQHCIACGVDLFALDAEARRERQKWRRLKFIVFFGVLGFGALMLVKHIPPGAQMLASVVSVVSMMLAAAIARD